MPAKGSTFDNDLLKLIFNAVSIDNIADNAASPLTNLYISLHTISPGIGGDQTTNEATYTNYSRVPMLRTTGGWTVSGSSVYPASTISFPQAGAGVSESETYFAVGTSSYPSTGKILYFGPISPTINVSEGVTAQLTTSTVITEN